MKNRYAAYLLAAAFLILFWLFSDNRVQMHTLPPEYSVQAR